MRACAGRSGCETPLTPIQEQAARTAADAYGRFLGLPVEPVWRFGMIGIAGLTGLAAGIYPAFVLSAFQPTTVLKGTSSNSATRPWMQRGLVVTRFAISIGLLVGTTVVFQPLQFIRNKDLGFDKDYVIVLPLESQAAVEGFDSIRTELLKNPNIIHVAAAGSLPGPGRVQYSTGFRKEGARAEEFFIADTGEVSPDYVETLGAAMTNPVRVLRYE